MVPNVLLLTIGEGLFAMANIEIMIFLMSTFPTPQF